MTGQEILRLRLRTQHLTGAPLDTAEEVVGFLCAVQAQEFAAAKWGLGQRARQVTEADVDRAFASGAILRTHVLRPTWHFVRALDLRWLVTLTAPRVIALMAYYDRQLALDARVYARSNAIIAGALTGGKQLTRPELGAALGRGGVVAQGQRLGHLMMRAELDLVVCSGAVRGKQHTYALVDERVPHAKARSRDEALAALTRRYFTSHGPATAKDYAWWAGLTVGDAKRAIASVERELERVVVDDRTFWFAGTGRPPRQGASPRAHLLQGYDEYVIGYSESRGLLDPSGKVGTVLGDRRFTHIVALDGRVVGHWRRVPQAKAAAVELSLRVPASAAEQRALAVELDGYGRFVGLPAVNMDPRALTR